MSIVNSVVGAKVEKMEKGKRACHTCQMQGGPLERHTFSVCGVGHLISSNTLLTSPGHLGWPPAMGCLRGRSSRRAGFFSPGPLDTKPMLSAQLFCCVCQHITQTSKFISTIAHALCTFRRQADRATKATWLLNQSTAFS